MCDTIFGYHLIRFAVRMRYQINCFCCRILPSILDFRCIVYFCSLRGITQSDQMCPECTELSREPWAILAPWPKVLFELICGAYMPNRDQKKMKKNSWWQLTQKKRRDFSSSWWQLTQKKEKEKLWQLMTANLEKAKKLL